MDAKTKERAADRLRAAKREFEVWRRGCRGPGRIPTELWVLGAEAAKDLGVQEAARELQVDAARLGQWVEQLGLSGGAKESAATEFVAWIALVMALLHNGAICLFNFGSSRLGDLGVSVGPASFTSFAIGATRRPLRETTPVSRSERPASKRADRASAFPTCSAAVFCDTG